MSLYHVEQDNHVSFYHAEAVLKVQCHSCSQGNLFCPTAVHICRRICDPADLISSTALHPVGRRHFSKSGGGGSAVAGQPRRDMSPPPVSGAVSIVSSYCWLVGNASNQTLCRLRAKPFRDGVSTGNSRHHRSRLYFGLIIPA